MNIFSLNVCGHHMTILCVIKFIQILLLNPKNAMHQVIVIWHESLLCTNLHFTKKIASDGDFMNGEWVRQFMLSASCMFLEIIIFFIPCIHSWASLLHESKFINTHTHILWRDFRIFWLLSFFVYEMRLHFFGIFNLRAERTFSLLEEF